MVTVLQEQVPTDTINDEIEQEQGIEETITLPWNSDELPEEIVRKHVKLMALPFKPEMLEEEGFTKWITLGNTEYGLTFNRDYIYAKLDRLLFDLGADDVVLTELLQDYAKGLKDRAQEQVLENVRKKNKLLEDCTLEEYEAVKQTLKRLRGQAA